ncbi:hypothetical protein LTR56_026264 [Elasticomyces elasticus]|nr:hypothetical protein LTR56_026264 [Elasticomyces elasticus]KAK3618467.1 hypothetical protein LTR22_026363 [Elasticomyces elasticus]KAK4903737.1 hypothetical protein LTR49_026679 [Elasticomyces elasticus]
MEVDLAGGAGGAGKGRRRAQRRGVGSGQLDGGEERPKMRRSRKGLHGVGEEGTRAKVRENGPKPKPRMLEPEEDVLGEEDLLETFGQGHLDLDRVTAQHAKILRRPAKGGTVPVDPQVSEDSKEADLYDYAFDPRRIGFQDPEAQHIVRDAEGRKLRQRCNCTSVGVTDTVAEWKFGEEGLDGKRASGQPMRFDANIEMQQPARKRMRAMGGFTPLSLTPDRAATPNLGGGMGKNTSILGLRRLGNVPKRIQQLRGESVESMRNEGDGSGSPAKHKGRPAGSKILPETKYWNVTPDF